MSLTRIEYGSLASSSVLNNNFDYLDDRIDSLSSSVDESIAGFSSVVETFNTSVNGLLAYKESFIATGMILPSLISTVPDGFLLCDGSELNVADFEDLYDVIGTTFGSSDRTKFNLPDLTNRTLWGSGGENSLCDYLSAGLPNITGRAPVAKSYHSSVSGALYLSGSHSAYIAYENSSYTDASNLMLNASRSSDIYGNSSTVQPPALVVDFIIKY